MEKPDLPIIWKKAESISGIVAALLLPIALVVVGHLIQEPLRQSERSIKMLEIAAEILKENNKNPDEVETGLRAWAIEVMEKHSGTQFPKPVKQAIESGRVQLPIPAENVTAVSAETPTASGPWLVVFGGNKDQQAALEDVKIAAEKWKLVEPRVYFRRGMYRSVSFSTDISEAQAMLETTKTVAPERKPYLVRVASWCPVSRKEKDVVVCE
jgi:hypothetical protein